MSSGNSATLSYNKHTSLTGNAGVRAQGLLTLAVQPTANDTITIGATTYTFKASVSVANDIKIGASLSETQTNLRNAVSLDGGTAGTDYGTGTTKNASARVKAFDTSNNAIVEANTPGTAGNSIASTETFTSGSNVFDATTLGTQQAGVNVTFIELPYASESLKTTSETKDKNRVRSDLQVSDINRQTKRSEGSVNSDFSYADYDDFLEASILCDTAFTDGHTEISAATTISFDASDNSINDSANGFTGGGNDYSQYSWIRVTGAANSSNNGVYKISTVAAGKLVLTGKTVVTEAAGNSITVKQGSQIKNGTRLQYFDLQRNYEDLTEEIVKYPVQAVTGIDISSPVDDDVSIALEFVGKPEVSDNFTNYTTLTAAANNRTFNSGDGIEAVIENLASTSVASFNISIKNGTRNLSELGTVGPAKFGKGTLMIEGTVELYYETKTLIDKYLNQTESSLSFVIKDSSDNTYVIDLPRIKYTDGERVGGGVDTDVIANMSFKAIVDLTENYTIKVSKI